MTSPIVIRVWSADDWWWVQVTYPQSPAMNGPAVPHPTREAAAAAAEQCRLRRFAIAKNRPCTVEIIE